MPDSESAGQGGNITLFFDKIGPVNQKLEKVSDLLNFHVRDIYIREPKLIARDGIQVGQRVHGGDSYLSHS